MIKIFNRTFSPDFDQRGIHSSDFMMLFLNKNCIIKSNIISIVNDGKDNITVFYEMPAHFTPIELTEDDVLKYRSKLSNFKSI